MDRTHRLRRALQLATRIGSTGMLMAVFLTGLVAPAPSTDPVLQAHDTLLSDVAVGAGWDETVPTGVSADMVGFTWTGGPGVVSIRVLHGDTWSDWTELEGLPDEGPDANSVEATPGQVSAGPAWVGHDVETIEVRIDKGTMANFVLHAIRTEPPERSPLAVPGADAAVPYPLIHSRADWGADESFRSFASGCDGQPDFASDTRFAVVHHTVNSNSYGPGDVPSIIRGIYYFHTHSNGWCDIGYNFLVDRFGGVWEGRAGGVNKPVIGAHSGGFNTYSTGVAAIGDFSSAGVPSAMYAGLRTILAFKLSYHGIDPGGTTIVYPYESPFSRFPAGQPVGVANISGHGDVDSTECPGQFLYSLLPQLRAEVAAIINANRDTRIMCDWNGDGVDTPAAFRNGAWYIRNENSEGPVQQTIYFGDPGDVPVCGDWTGTGKDTVGVFRGGMWYLRNSNTSGVADFSIGYGDPGDMPVTGDWNGTQTTKIGVVRRGAWYIRNVLGTGVADQVFAYGDLFDRPVVGDWDGNGTDTPGVFRGGGWYLRNSNSSGVADRSIGFGGAADIPLPYVVSKSGLTDNWALGVARGAYWFLSNDTTSAATANVFAF